MAKEAVKLENKLFFVLALLFFVLFYPMLISIYVFLPLFIGAMSYTLIEGLETKRSFFIFIGVIYLVNLEVNLSLPLFLSIIIAFVFYLTFYSSLLHFRRCKICKPLLSVFILDFMYLGALMGFDFIFQTHSIELDNILLYSLVVDMLIVVLL
jgi:hypothetical protein